MFNMAPRNVSTIALGSLLYFRYTAKTTSIRGIRKRRLEMARVRSALRNQKYSNGKKGRQLKSDSLWDIRLKVISPYYRALLIHENSAHWADRGCYPEKQVVFGGHNEACF
jgi:hypothetical protein